MYATAMHLFIYLSNPRKAEKVACLEAHACREIQCCGSVTPFW
jgi:hypothetical protein